MDWLKKHTDTAIVVGSIMTCMLWMNGRFNDIDRQFNKVECQFKDVEKEIAIIKAVMIMKGVMPTELAKADINE